MRLTTKGRYAVTAMLDLALHAESGPVTAKRPLVVRVRGPGGGYQLAAEAQSISVASVIDAVDESVDATRCGGQGDCHEGEVCLTHHLWTDLSSRIHQFLSGITIGDLIARREIRRIAGRQDTQLNSRRLQLIQS